MLSTANSDRTILHLSQLCTETSPVIPILQSSDKKILPFRDMVLKMKANLLTSRMIFLQYSSSMSLRSLARIARSTSSFLSASNPCSVNA